MRDATRPSLELRLAELAPQIAFPATPPLAESVRSDLLRAPRRSPWRRPMARGAALALAATLLLVGVAAAVGIALGGLRLVFGPASFSPAPSLSVGPGLGEATTLAGARGQISFDLRVPQLDELGEPDLVYLADPPEGGAVTLLYADRAEFPARTSTGIGLIVTQFRADIGPEIFEKWIDTGVSVTQASVDGHRAWWVAGGDHFFFYVDANGQVVNTTLRLAAPTLIWEEDGVTHRVEGAPTLAGAVRIAESLE